MTAQLQLNSTTKLWLSCLVAFLCTFISPIYAESFEPIEINGQQIEVLIDPEHRLTVDNIINQKNLNWESSRHETPSYGFSAHTYWFRFTLPAQKSESILELNYALLDDISYFRLEDDKIIETIVTGDKRNFSDRPIQHRVFLFPVPGSNQKQTILLKVRSSSAIQIPLTLWPGKSFFEQDQYAFIEHGIYYGIALVMILYNLFLFFRLRDSAYGFYVFYVITFAFVQLSLSGFSYQFIWPGLPEWNEKSITVLIPLIVVSTSIFSSHFLKLTHYYPRIYTILYGQAIIGVVLSTFSVFLPYHTIIPYVVLLATISCLTIFSISYYVMFKRMYKYAIYFAAARSVFLVGVIVLVMNKFGILPRTWMTESAPQIGSLIELILLSFALAERLYDAMQRRFMAEDESIIIKEKLIQTQQKQNQILESEVAARTQDLEAALNKVNILNNELSDLSTMDQVTGVRNRRYFDDMLVKEFRRAFRNHSNISLIMLDLDHFKSVNDTYGHLAGDLCLKTIANAIYNIVKRPPDLVCRYGGEELAIILPETDLKGAMIIAERIRHQIESLQIKFSGETFSVTASLGVSSFTPNSNKTPNLLIELADNALYQAKNEGRNCTRNKGNI